jgi:sugar phosphate isomerase/epimerase
MTFVSCDGGGERYHAKWNGDDYRVAELLESGTDPAALIQAMDSRLTTVHLADYAPEGPRHLPPGEGMLDWPDVLGTLQTVAYSGPLILEPAHVEDVTVFLRARDFVRQVLTDVAPGND